MKTSKWQLRAVRWKSQSVKLVVRAHTDVRTIPRIKVELLLPRVKRGAATGVESDFEHQPDSELTSSDSSDEESMSSDSGSDVSSDVWCLEDDIIDMVSMIQCTRGADGRANKDCPMNSRHRYSGHTLFPPLVVM